MKDWKIGEPKEIDEIGSLLNKYAKSLSESTSNVLNGYCEIDISNNKIYHILNVTNKNSTIDVKIFKIKVLDMDGKLDLFVYYYDKTEILDSNINVLEQKLDSIIQSTRMANYIGHLMNCTKINKK